MWGLKFVKLQGRENYDLVIFKTTKINFHGHHLKHDFNQFEILFLPVYSTWEASLESMCIHEYCLKYIFKAIFIFLNIYFKVLI